jgi:N-acetylneuraminic acid mutarotase
MIRNAILASILTLLPTICGADPGWRPAPEMPVAAQEIYGADRADRFYTLGGFGADGAPVAAAQVFDARAGSWSMLPPLPEPRHHVGVAIAGGRLYAIGGFTGTPPEWRATDAVSVFDFETEEWRPGPSLPVARGEHVTVVVADEIIVIGGRVPRAPGAARFGDHADTSRVDILDTATGTWRRGANAPTARNSAAGGVIDGRVHVVGGRQFDPGAVVSLSNVAIHEVYDAQRDSWSRRPPMPQAQGGLSAAVLDGRLHVFGGEAFSPRPHVFPDTWAFDPESGGWRPQPSMRTPRHGTAAATLSGALHVFGGATRAGLGAVGTVERRTPD